MTIAVAICVFDQVEVLDFAGPYEVFTTANRLAAKECPASKPPFSVITVAQTTQAITARAGLAVLPDYSMHNHPAIDVLLVAGGVVDAVMQDAEVIGWIAQTAQQAQLCASVCTGAFLLAQAQVISQHTVTTHWEDRAELARLFPALTVVANQRWVDQGSVITSAGISAGVDMALHMVSRLHSETLAVLTAQQMEWTWQRT